MTTPTMPTTKAPLAAAHDVAAGGSGAGRIANLLVFLRTELAPSPARVRATLRIVIACLVAAALVMALRIPNGHWLIITIFIVSQPNVGASIEKAMLRLLGTLIGALGVILAVVAFPQSPWFFIPVVAALIGIGAFLSRTTTAPYVALLGSLTVVLFIADESTDPILSIEDGLWRLGVVALAEVIATAAQLLLWPDDPEELLLDDFVAILRAVEARLGRFLLGGAAAVPRPDELARLRDAAFNGLARHLDLLANAETRYRSLRRRHAEQLAVIGNLNRLTTALLSFETLLRARPAALPVLGREGPLHQRVAAIRESVAAVRAAIAERRPPPPTVDLRATFPPLAGPAEASLLPPLAEMARALAAIPPALASLGEHERRREAGAAAEPAQASFLDDGGTRFLTPACTLSNTRDLRFAGQVTLAAMLCYLIVAGLRWPAIITAVVTCVIVAQSSFGATVQKALLRIAGAILGGLIGLAAILVVMPNFDTLPPFLIAVGLGTAAAAWVSTGSARISYVGVQMALAFAMCTLDAHGPVVDLLPPRDRVLGILLGNVVTGAVMLLVWPVFAGREMARSLESALRHLAQLSRVGISGGIDESVARPARGFRLQIVQDLAATLRLHAEAQFEPGAAAPEHRDEQQRLLRLHEQVQAIFLVTLGAVRNRINAGIAATGLASVAQLRAFALAIGPSLEAAADALACLPPRSPPPLREIVVAAEEAFAADRAALAGSPARARDLAGVAGQLEFYRDLTPMLEGLLAEARELHAAQTSPRSAA